MYITSLFLNTYSTDRLIKGQVEFKNDDMKITVDFNEKEAAEIQTVAVRAWERRQAEMIKQIQTSSPALTMLPAPVIEEAEYSEVEF